MIQNNDELNKVIVESPEDVAYTIGLDDRFISVSPAVKHLFGYEPQELVGVSIKNILTPESYRKQREGMEKAARENRKESDILLLEVVKKNGEKALIEAVARFQRDSKNNVVAILGTAKAVKV